MNEGEYAFILAQTALLNCRVAGMVAENQHRTNCGNSLAYTEQARLNIQRGGNMNEHLTYDEKADLREQAMRATIPDLAEDKFNSLPLLYTKPEALHQCSNMEDVIDGVTTKEWQGIAECLRDGYINAAACALEDAVRRVCLKRATDAVEEML